ncbi:MAG: DUF4249 family protein [Fluviicola sp.]
MIQRLLYILIPGLVLFSCTKEVEVDIPGYEERIVIDGRIETGQPPFVLLSSTKEVYAPTDVDAFLNGFISGAVVTVSDGTNTIVLTEVCSGNLPPGTEEIASQILGIPAEDLSNYNICAYVGLDPVIWGQVGKTYTLTVEYDGQTYNAETTLVPPTSLVNTFWKPEGNLTNHGFSWATLADPPGQYDAYFWEANIIGNAAGDTTETGFTPTFNPVFDDEFFDGLEFEFAYENPHAVGDGVPDSTRFMYALGDTVVIKLSKLDRVVFEYYEKKHIQLQTAGNPFATPTNIPTNLSNGALGVWAGFSPYLDTLVCEP